MTTFQDLFQNVPAGNAMVSHWRAADPAALDAAAAAISAHGANPWVFSADARHFWQFARLAEVSALNAMSADAMSALLDWSDPEDFDPATFGYGYPSES